MESLPSKRDLRALRHDHRDFLRVLILDPWFRVAFVLAVLAFVGVLVSLPKLWRTTPPGFRPQVRVSLLNLAQAWQLQRAARASEAEGKAVEAIQNWYAAVHRNAADVETVRNVLRLVVESPNVPTKLLDRVSGLPAWLLKLSATNQDDVVLVARYLDRTGVAEGVYELLDPLKDHLSPRAEVCYLKALIERRDQQGYEARWRRVESELKTDPEFALYHQAYLATWGPLAGRAEARARLEAAVADPGFRIQALRLQLLPLADARNVKGYAAILDQLTALTQDRVEEHIQYWGLLSQAARRDEACALARQFTLRTMNGRDLLALAEAYEGLDLRDEANRLLRSTTLNYGGTGSPIANMIWLARANLLVRVADWPGLLEMVEQLRAFPLALEALGGWVDALEGQAQHGLGRSEQALAAFNTAAHKQFWTARLQFEVGLLAKQLGYFQPALTLLLGVEKDFRDVSAYWEAVFALDATLRQDAVLLLKAATELRRLAPRNPDADFNYAAALLVNRLDPAQAVAMTREFLSRAPNSPQITVNYCLALALNQRFDEAAALLKTVDPSRFDESGASTYHACAFEVALGRNDLTSARQHLAVIQPRYCFPNQVEWFERMRRERLEKGVEKPNR